MLKKTSLLKPNRLDTDIDDTDRNPGKDSRITSFRILKSKRSLFPRRQNPATRPPSLIT
jgi:hypothetical protein